MDDLEREYRVFPVWVGVIGGVFFSALLFGASLGLFYATGYDPFKVPDPRNGTALLISMGAGVVGMMLGWWASFADWLVIKRDTLWYTVENISDRLRDSRKKVRELEDLLRYVPESTLEWAERQREEALSAAVAEEASMRSEASTNPPASGGVHETI